MGVFTYCTALGAGDGAGGDGGDGPPAGEAPHGEQHPPVRHGEHVPGEVQVKYQDGIEEQELLKELRSRSKCRRIN